MNVAVVGSRTWADADLFTRSMRALAAKTPIGAIVTGDAPGADALARKYAEGNALPLTVYRADWQQHGKAAGPMRNTQIVADAGLLVAFWDEETRGTRDSLDKAAKKGIPAWVITPEGRRYKYPPSLLEAVLAEFPNSVDLTAAARREVLTERPDEHIPTLLREPPPCSMDDSRCRLYSEKQIFGFAAGQIEKAKRTNGGCGRCDLVRLTLRLRKAEAEREEEARKAKARAWANRQALDSREEE